MFFSWTEIFYLWKFLPPKIIAPPPEILSLKKFGAPKSVDSQICWGCDNLKFSWYFFWIAAAAYTLAAAAYTLAAAAYTHAAAAYAHAAAAYAHAAAAYVRQCENNT